MARIIEFEGRTIEVPDDATDAEVSQILGGSPAQPAPPPPATDVRLAPPISTPTGHIGWRDQQPVAPAAPAAPAPSNPGRALKLGFQGVGSGAANVAGLPVDLMAGLQNLLSGGVNAVAGTNLPYVHDPFGGSQSIKNAASGVASAFGAPPVPKEQMSSPERLVYNATDYGTQALMTGGALAARAPVVAADALLGSAPVKSFAARTADSLARPYAQNAKATFAGDAAAGLGSGVGVDMADNYAKDSPIGQLLGALAGGVGGVALKEIVQHTGAGLARLFTGRAPEVFGEPGAQRTLYGPNGAPVKASTAETTAQLFQNLAVDPAQAAETIGENAGRMRSAGLPMPTSGLVSGDVGLMGAETGARTSTATPFIVNDNKLRAAATERVTALRDPGANQGAVNTRAGGYAQERIAPLDANVRSAEQMAQDARGAQATEAAPFVGMNSADQAAASGRMRDAVVEPYTDWRREKNQRFNAIDPDRSRFTPADGMFDAVARVRDGINNLGPQGQQFPAEFTRRLDQLAAFAAEHGTMEMLPVGDLVDVRKYMATAAETARRTGNFTLADHIDDLRSTVNRTIEASPDAAAANDFYRQGAARYRPNPNDPVGRFTRDVDRRQEPPPSTFGDRMLATPESASAYQRATAPDAGNGAPQLPRPEGVPAGPPAQTAGEQAARDFLRADFAKVTRGGAIEPRAATAWRDRHAAVLDQFPAIRQEFDDLVANATTGAAHTAEAGVFTNETRAARDAVQRQVERGPAGDLIGGKTPRELVDTALNSKYGAARQIEEIRRVVGSDPEAVRGLRAAVADVVADRVNSVANAGGNTAGPGPAMSASLAALRKTFKDHEQVLAAVFGPEDMNRLRQAHQVLEPLLNASVKATAGSNTADKLAQFKRLGEAALKLKFGQLQGGGMMRSFRLMAESLPDRGVDVQALIQRAWFDPELARHLLTRETRDLSGASAGMKALGVRSLGAGSRESVDEDK